MERLPDRVSAFARVTRACARASALPCVLVLSWLPIGAVAGPGAMREVPASGITIKKTWLNEHQQVGETGVCAAFANTTAVPAIRVEFLYSLIAKDGQVLYSAVHEAMGEFAPGALIQGENQVTCDTAYGVFYSRGSAGTRDGDGTFVASVSQVEFADGSWWHAGPDIVGGVLPQADAAVQIARSFSWEPGRSTQECVTFHDAGLRTVRRIHFIFSHIADDGSDIVDDPYEVNPSQAGDTVCRGWNGSLTPRVGTAPEGAKPEILVFGKSARLVAWVGEIDFTDGTSWRAPQPDAAALIAVAVPNAVDYAHAVWWPNQIAVDEAAPPQSASGIEISKSYAWAFADSNECVDFTNRSLKAISHVRFVFSHLASDGSPLGNDEPLDVRGSVGPGATKAANCRDFNGNVALPVEWSGGNTSGTVYLDGRPSTISVRVDQVDFADGTSWQAP